MGVLMAAVYLHVPCSEVGLCFFLAFNNIFLRSNAVSISVSVGQELPSTPVTHVRSHTPKHTHTHTHIEL